MMGGWDTSNGQWRAWIDEDAATQHPVWVSCDTLDEDLRLRLESKPFLGEVSETTVVSPIAVSRPNAAAFDSAVTMIREAEDDTAMDFEEAAKTLVHGRIDDEEPDEPADERQTTQPRGEIEVGVAAPGGSLEVGLEAVPAGERSSAVVMADAGVSADADVTPEAGLPLVRTGDTIPPIAPDEPSQDAAVPSAIPADEEFYIPTLTKGETTEPSAEAPEPPPPPAEPPPPAKEPPVPPRAEAMPAPAPEPPPMAPQPPPPPPAAAAMPAPEPPPPPPAAEAKPAPEPPPPPAAEAMPAPAPEPPPPPPAAEPLPSAAAPPPPPDPASVQGLVEPGLASRAVTPTGDPGERHADQSAASSQTAGEIMADQAAESVTEGELPDDLKPRKRRKTIIAVTEPRPPEPLEGEDVTDELSADDLVEDDEEAPTPAQAVAAPPPAPEKKPPPAPEPKPPPAPAAPPPLPTADAAAPPPLPTADAAAPPPAPAANEGAPPPAANENAPAANEAGPGSAPAANDGGGATETASALASLQVQMGGGSLAALQKQAQEAGPATGKWFEEVFAEHYPSLERPRHAQMARAEVEFFVAATGLNPGAMVLDIGCGDGAHCIALAQRGFVPTGIDGSLPQLLRAAQTAEQLALGVQFLHGDMRDPPVDGPFAGILCIGSTLGYFEDDENRACIKRMADLLVAGGRVLIQVFNRDQVIGRLPARSWWQGSGCLVLDEAQMNYMTNRLYVHRTVVFEDGRQFEHHISVAAYALGDLLDACNEAGLHVLEISGSRHTRARFYGATSPEIWLVAEKQR